MDPNEFRRIVMRSIALPLALMLVVTALLLWQIRHLSTTAQWADHTQQVIVEANEIQKLLLDLETGLRGYVITNDRAFLEPYEQSRPVIEKSLDDLRQMVADNPVQVERLAEVTRLMAEWQSHASEAIALRQQDGDVRGLVSSLRGKRLMDQIRDRFTDFLGEEERLRQERSQDTRRAVRTALLGSVLLMVFLGGGLALFIRRQLLSLSAAYDRILETVKEQKREQERMREELISIQAARLEELSTPLIPLSRDILLLPLIGTIDPNRAEQVLEVLTNGVVEHAARVAILDITGVAAVDTHVAGLLIQAARTVRLVGAEVVLTGTRPAVAQTLAQLGVELTGVATRSTLEAGLAYARQRLAAEDQAILTLDAS